MNNSNEVVSVYGSMGTERSRGGRKDPENGLMSRVCRVIRSEVSVVRKQKKSRS